MLKIISEVLGRNLFFFVCGQFHLKLDETGRFVFCFFGSKMKLAVVSWVKLAKIVKPSRVGREKNETDGRGVGKKNETDGTRLRRGRQFHFFSDRIWTVS